MRPWLLTRLGFEPIFFENTKIQGTRDKRCLLLVSWCLGFDNLDEIVYYIATMIAVIATGGKQYLVKEGDKIEIEKIKGEKGEAVTFDKVLLTSEEDGSKLSVGTPNLSTKVTGKVMEQGRHDKIEVVHYKAKVRYKKRSGHRQPFTRIEITKIG